MTTHYDKPGLEAPRYSCMICNTACGVAEACARHFEDKLDLSRAVLISASIKHIQYMLQPDVWEIRPRWPASRLEQQHQTLKVVAHDPQFCTYHLVLAATLISQTS